MASSAGESSSNPKKDDDKYAPKGRSFLSKLVSADSTPIFLLLGHWATIVCALGYFLPFSGFHARYTFYKYCVRSVVATSLVKLHTRHGLPPLSFAGGFSREALALGFDKLKNWFGPIQQSTDFHYMFVAMAVSAHPPFTVALCPFVCLALYHVMAYLSTLPVLTRTFVWTKFLGKFYNALRRGQREALIFNATMEIALFFAVIIRLFTKMRSIMLVFMIFNTLKMRYLSPDSTHYHKYVWQQIDARFVQPYLLRYLPQLQRPLEMVQRVFTQPR